MDNSIDPFIFFYTGLLPPANEVWSKVIFLHLFVILFTGGRAWLLGGYAWLLGGSAWDMTKYGDTINEQAVRILLECILVNDSGYRGPKTVPLIL